MSVDGNANSVSWASDYNDAQVYETEVAAMRDKDKIGRYFTYGAQIHVIIAGLSPELIDIMSQIVDDIGNI